MPFALPRERSEEHTSELQSHHDLVCRLLLEKKKETTDTFNHLHTTFFLSNDSALPEIHTLSLHDALPISQQRDRAPHRGRQSAVAEQRAPPDPQTSTGRRLAHSGRGVRDRRCRSHCRGRDRKSTRLNSSHITISYAVFCLKKKKKQQTHSTTCIPLFFSLMTLRSPRSTLFPYTTLFRSRSNVIARLIEVDNQPLLNNELHQIRKLQLAGASLIPVEEFVTGDAVRIAEGEIGRAHV